jgi:hypothetical protein
VSSSNTALLPASAATLSSGCGTSSFNCILSLKPAGGQSGQATVTVTAHDLYGQSARGTLALGITPAAGGGGAFDCWSLVVLGIWLVGSGGGAGARPRRCPNR